jgi:pimeloyl-ACP methyl ester carboxylesterase
MRIACPRIIFLPGLACDARLLEPQRALPADIEVPPWIDPLDEHESLTSYARRLAATLDTSRPFHLGGISFGGMVAVEVARHVRPERLFLMSSCTSRRGIPHAARVAGDVLLPYLPPPVLKRVKTIPSMMRKFGPARLVTGNAVVREMLRECCPRLFAWSLAAVLTWDGHADPLPPLVHVKGDRDCVLPPHLCRPTHVVRGAGHLMNLTHAREVNEVLARYL